jgi:hypothetical protein
MKSDVSSHAVTMRLKQTSELRRLCLALKKRNRPKGTKTGGSGGNKVTSPNAPSPRNLGQPRDKTRIKRTESFIFLR